MTALAQRWAWSAVVLALFAGAVGVLAWTWTTTQSSSAAFADIEDFAGNHLGAGTVDVALGPDTVRFSAVNMAAGDVATGHLEIANGGTLPLRFALSAGAADGPLVDVLDLVAWRATAPCPSAPPTSSPTWHPLHEARPQVDPLRSESTTAGRLDPGDSVVVCMSAELPLTATSSVQGRRLDLDLRVDAVHDIDAGDVVDGVDGGVG